MSLVNIFALSFVELFGDMNLADYANTGAPSALVQGVTGYALVVIFLIRCLMQGNLLYVNGMWDGVSGIVTAGAAYLLMGDRLSGWPQYLGLLMICAGTFLLHTPHKELNTHKKSKFLTKKN